MSNELVPTDNSAAPQHAPRATDINPASEKRAEQQIAILFGLSGVGSLLLIYSYIYVAGDVFIFIPIMGNQNAQQLGIGIGMAMSLFFIGIAAIHWAKTLMPDKEVVNHRHEFRSSDEDREEEELVEEQRDQRLRQVSA